jgi:3-deoxy-manno-octulosonate cytidylyltransferase (CMP-KDO synthetase)
MKVLAVIPSRLDSKRLPGKALCDIHGIPMIFRVYQQVKKAKKIERVVVATDSNQIVDAVCSRGGEAVLTSKKHQSGTDRIIEVSHDISEDYVLNVQGDEPFIDPALLDNLIEFFAQPKNQNFDCVTPVVPFGEDEKKEIKNPDIVKVVLSAKSRALYFSRYPVPFLKDKNIQSKNEVTFYRHLGVYLYKKEFLLKYKSLPLRTLELAESLEQLRVLENDGQIGVYVAESAPFDVNTRADLRWACKYAKKIEQEKKA